MFGIQNHTSFVIAVLLFQLIPGPGTIVILNATARNGVRAGGAAVLGTIAGDFVFMVAAVAGLAAIMHSHPFIFQALQWFGAAYLVLRGIQLLRMRLTHSEHEPESICMAAICFRQAFAISLTNPKVILFFVSFFPLFIQPDASAVTLVIMMAHVTVLSLLYQGLLVLLGNRVAFSLSNYPSARKITSRLAGFALIGFGIRLVIDK